MGKLTLALGAGENPLSPAVSEPWITPDQLGGCDPGDDVDLASVCSFVSELLFLWSGKKYGVRTETVRPQAGQRGCGYEYLSPNWEWRTYYGEGRPTWVVLKAPVRAITQVKVDGVALSSTAWAVYEGRKLVRTADPITGATLHWPVHQRLELADTEVGTFSVTYQWGRDVPAGGSVAAQAFACEITKYLTDQPTALPDRLVSMTRQGITQTIEDPQQFLDKGRTGLYIVDAWLGAVNPHGNRRRPRVMSPESVALQRRTD